MMLETSSSDTELHAVQPIVGQSLFGGDNSTSKLRRGSRNFADIQNTTKDMSLLDSTLPPEDIVSTVASASSNADDTNTVVSDRATTHSENSTPVSKQNIATIEDACDENLNENGLIKQQPSKSEISDNLMNFSPLNFVSSSPKDEQNSSHQQQENRIDNVVETSISGFDHHLIETTIDTIEEPMDVADSSVNSTDSYLTAASGVSMYDEPPLTAKDSYATCDLDVDQALFFLSQSFGTTELFRFSAAELVDDSLGNWQVLLMSANSVVEDLNANLNRTFDGACESFVVDKTIVEAPKIQLVPSTPQKKNIDELNSNMTLEEKSPKINTSTPNKLPTTPKSQNSDSHPAKKDSTGRNFTAQQTAVVAPMVNRSFESVSKQSPVPAQSSMIAVVASSPAKATSQPLASSMSLSQAASNDEMFVQPSTNVFMNATDFDYLQQRPTIAASAAGSASDTNLCRQSLYLTFRFLNPLFTSFLWRLITAFFLRILRKSAQKRIDESNLPSMRTTPKSTVPKKDTSDASLVCPPTVVLKKKPPPTSSSANDLVMDDLIDSPPAQRRHSFDEDSIFSPFECEFLDFTTNESETVDNIVRKCQAYIVAKEKEWLKKFREEREKSDKLSKENKDIKLNLDEYHKTMEEFIQKVNELETNKQRFGDYDQILKEKERAVEDLRTVENALSELHRRYESLRSNVEEHKKNEEKWKELLASYENQVQVSEDMFRKLKQHAEEKLEAANAEIVRLRKAKDSDTVALKALCKKRDLQVVSLEKTLEQKQREIQELSAICDELIQKLVSFNFRFKMCREQHILKILDPGRKFYE
uniref:Transforming acidic coiled-coil-containing protein C-terminal domain-containing protein n=1 Tax=Romanomermis culicivorax TaxID=13658 RepID=A0A915KTP5_ROMCU